MDVELDGNSGELIATVYKLLQGCQPTSIEECYI